MQYTVPLTDVYGRTVLDVLDERGRLRLDELRELTDAPDHHLHTVLFDLLEDSHLSLFTVGEEVIVRAE